MELTAAIEGLAALKYRCRVELVSDSKYLCDAGESRLGEVVAKARLDKSDKKPALNPDLWERLLELLDAHDVEVVWVRGHAGHEYNERCDSSRDGNGGQF